MREKKENELIGQFILFYWIVRKTGNIGCICIIGWVDKKDKVVFENVKYVFFYIPIAKFLILEFEF